MPFFLLIAWAACVCISFVGYGKALLRACGLRDQSWPLAGTLGIALIVALGGFLELAGWVKGATVIAIVIAGDLLFAINIWHDLSQQVRTSSVVSNACHLLAADKTSTALFLLLTALLILRLTGNLQPGYFHVNDDLGGYLSFPVEMLQLGSLPSDPFSHRRVTSGYGGSYFLQTFTVVGADPRTIRFIDWGFGSVLYAGLAFAIGRRLTLSRKNALALTLLTFVIPLRKTNASMVVLPAALFATLFLLQLLPDTDKRRRWNCAVLLGLTAGALCTLKATFLPAAVIICALFYCGELIRGRRLATLAPAVLTALSAGITLFPWMLDLKNKEGTFLFPALGSGYEVTKYSVPGGVASADLGLWTGIIALTAPLLAAAAIGFIPGNRDSDPEWQHAPSFFLATAISTVVISLATGGESIARYALPFLSPGLVIFVAYLVRWRHLLTPRPRWLLVTSLYCAASLGAIVLGYGIHNNIYREYLTDVGLPPATDDVISFDADAEKNRVATLQKQVPPGEPILEHLLVSYPLDFRRNPIYIADFPGLAGLAPGLPVGKGASSLRDYLLLKHIRFVAFTYGRGRFVDIAPAFTLPKLLANPALGGRHTLLYIQNKVALDVQTNLDALSKEHLRTYDDGEDCVVDLTGSS